MKNSTRLITIIIINIIISAVTTLTVLWLWDLAHPRPSVIQPTGPAAAENSALSEQEEAPNTEIEPSLEPAIEYASSNTQVTIRVIVGAGNLEVEYVEILNESAEAVDLTGWLLVDENGHQFTFPALILNGGGAIKVLSKTGDNTVIELYWQADAPIWQSGETATLLNAGGETIATYSLP